MTGRFTGLIGIALVVAVGSALSRDRRAIRWSRLGFRAMLAGTLANFLSAAIAGILL